MQIFFPFFRGLNSFTEPCLRAVAIDVLVIQGRIGLHPHRESAGPLEKAGCSKLILIPQTDSTF